MAAGHISAPGHPYFASGYSRVSSWCGVCQHGDVAKGGTAMSMIARFVQVQPSLLQDLLEDPSSVESMFEDQPVEGSGVQTAEVAERMRKLFATRGAAMVAGGLPGLDPKMREALNQRLEQLGVNMEALKAGQGGEALADLLMSRMGMMRKGTGAGAGRAPKGRGAAISLDKAWHGVHYLLCGSAVPD